MFSETAFKDFQPVQYTPTLDSNISFTDHSLSSTHYYNQDERQSVRNTTSTSGNVAQSYDYTAYGDKVDALTEGSVVQRYTYTGREASNVSDLYYFRYRLYAPYTGSFVGRDPLGYVDGISVYSGNFVTKMGLDHYGQKAVLPGEIGSSGPQTCSEDHMSDKHRECLDDCTNDYQTASQWCRDNTKAGTIKRNQCWRRAMTSQAECIAACADVW